MNKDLFNKLASEEENFFKTEFLSPVLAGKPIQVRIAGVVVTLKVSRPKKFQGWGVFVPTSYKEARKVRDPNLKQKQEYLKLFPCLRLVLCRKTDDQWFGIPAHQADSRFKITGLVPVYLAEEVQMFNVIRTGWDGKTCWFEGADSRRNPRAANYLRESLTKELEPDKLEFAGLTQEERDAYHVVYNDDIESKKDRTEEKIKHAIQHGGGVYKSYIQREKTFTIEFSVDGHQHRSTVNKDTLQVQTSGICLAGHDKNFDLHSLVGVLREGQGGRGRGNYHDDRYYDAEDAEGRAGRDYDEDW